MTPRSWLTLACAACFLAGGCILTNSWLTRQRSANVPVMSCTDLIRNGPGPHPHVTVTGLRLSSGGYLLERDGETGALDELVQPIYPASLGREPDPADLVLLLQIMNDREKTKLLAQPDLEPFTCAVGSASQRIEPSMRQALEKQYPGLSVVRCQVLTVGLHEPTPERADQMIWQGIALLGLAGLLLAWRTWRPPAEAGRDCQSSVP
jgi:hypothetical protein